MWIYCSTFRLKFWHIIAYDSEIFNNLIRCKGTCKFAPAMPEAFLIFPVWLMCCCSSGRIDIDRYIPSHRGITQENPLLSRGSCKKRHPIVVSHLFAKLFENNHGLLHCVDRITWKDVRTFSVLIPTHIDLRTTIVQCLINGLIRHRDDICWGCMICTVKCDVSRWRVFICTWSESWNPSLLNDVK